MKIHIKKRFKNDSAPCALRRSLHDSQLLSQTEQSLSCDSQTRLEFSTQILGLIQQQGTCALGRPTILIFHFCRDFLPLWYNTVTRSRNSPQTYFATKILRTSAWRKTYIGMDSACKGSWNVIWSTYVICSSECRMYNNMYNIITRTRLLRGDPFCNTIH